VALPERQLRPCDGELGGELGLEVRLAAFHGQPARLQEPAACGGEVAAGDVEPGPLQACVYALGAGEPVPFQNRTGVPVGLVPAAEQKLEDSGCTQEGVAPRRGPEPAAGLGPVEGEGQRLLEQAAHLAGPGQLHGGPAEPVDIGLLLSDALGVAHLGKPPVDVPEIDEAEAE
jgi:hypothetical protein